MTGEHLADDRFVEVWDLDAGAESVLGEQGVAQRDDKYSNSELLKHWSKAHML
jgi:hypothetical protein